jgi:N-acetylglucosamine kinase-like BadF-type ATPase
MMEGGNTEYFVGIDGGASKTRLLLTDASGKRLAEAEAGGAYYRQDGVESVIDVLRTGLALLFGRAGTPVREDAVAVCFGMPGHGENKTGDSEAAQRIAEAFSPMRMCFVNDVACAWAGATGLASGVALIMGTGAMAWGRNDAGDHARCGGWSEFFSDEGSGYWIGKKTLEAFSRQHDGRAEKTLLYGLVKKRFGLRGDDVYSLSGKVDDTVAGSRKETARLQEIMLEAARAGDRQALGIYREAAKELALIVYGCANSLGLGAGPVKVSFCGGLSNIHDVLMPHVRPEVKRLLPEAEFAAPLSGPSTGAILIACERFSPQQLPLLKKTLFSA